MKHALVLACLLGACVPDFDRDSFVSSTESVDGSQGGLDLGTTDAGDGCTPGAFTFSTCVSAPHLLFAHSPTGYITIERFGPKDAACEAVTLPGVTGTARAVAELGASLAVAVGAQVAIVSDGQIRCTSRAGHEPADLFVRDHAFAIAWRPTGGGAIDAIELDGEGDLGVGTTAILRVTQSPFLATELVGSTGLTDTGASYTFDPDEPADPTQPYAFGAGVTLDAVAADGETRVAWVSATDPRVVYHVDGRTSTPSSSACSVALARAIPAQDSGVAYRTLGTDGQARTLSSSSCDADALNDLEGHAAPYDAIGLGVTQ